MSRRNRREVRGSSPRRRSDHSCRRCVPRVEQSAPGLHRVPKQQCRRLRTAAGRPRFEAPLLDMPDTRRAPQRPMRLRLRRSSCQPQLKSNREFGRRAIAVQDAAALAGAALAGPGLLVHELGGPVASDAVASLLIGLLLAATATGLARPLGDLLIGRSIPPARLEKAYAILADSSGVEQLLRP